MEIHHSLIIPGDINQLAIKILMGQHEAVIGWMIRVCWKWAWK